LNLRGNIAFATEKSRAREGNKRRISGRGKILGGFRNWAAEATWKIREERFYRGSKVK